MTNDETQKSNIAYTCGGFFIRHSDFVIRHCFHLLYSRQAASSARGTLASVR